jgi:hypothetical protein
VTTPDPARAPSSLDRLAKFFESAPVARKATAPLARSARVNLVLEEGPAHFTMESGRAGVGPGQGEDPDFTLTLPAEAVRRVTTIASEDLGEFGIAFFKLVLDRDPAVKVRIHVNAPTTRLLTHGYLGVLALGGMKVTWWLVKNGVKNPKAAIDRLRGVR